MSLLLTIIKHTQSVVVEEVSKKFSDGGGTIGRGMDNDWILPDPERFLSSRHVQITAENMQYYLTDLSTNGVFINGASEPVGKSNRTLLNEGDIFEIGDYQFSVQFLAADSDAAYSYDSPFENGRLESDKVDIEQGNFKLPSSSWEGADPFAASSPGVISEPLFSQNGETDPLAALDKAQSNSGVQSLTHNQPYGHGVGTLGMTDSYSDEANALNQSVEWPESKAENNAALIPEGWDQTTDSWQNSNLDEPVESGPAQQAVVVPPQPQKQTPVPSPAKQPANISKTADKDVAGANRRKALERANQKIQTELEQLKRQAASKQKKANGSGSDLGLLEALGFNTDKLSNEQVDGINQVVADFVRETVAGMMQVLSSRNSLKNEFRMNVTTIQPIENNPLKFSANVDDALENMFIKQGNAYKKPVEAIREGFEGIAEHQMALLAGVRAGFGSLTQRFDPVKLEEKFQRQNKSGFIPGSKKAKHWDSYCEYYEDLMSNSDNAFHYLFGHDFVRAYEDQLQKLLLSKKAQK